MIRFLHARYIFNGVLVVGILYAQYPVVRKTYMKYMKFIVGSPELCAEGRNCSSGTLRVVNRVGILHFLQVLWCVKLTVNCEVRIATVFIGLC